MSGSRFLLPFLTLPLSFILLLLSCYSYYYFNWRTWTEFNLHYNLEDPINQSWCLIPSHQRSVAVLFFIPWILYMRAIKCLSWKSHLTAIEQMGFKCLSLEASWQDNLVWLLRTVSMSEHVYTLFPKNPRRVLKLTQMLEKFIILRILFHVMYYFSFSK